MKFFYNSQRVKQSSMVVVVVAVREASYYALLYAIAIQPVIALHECYVSLVCVYPPPVWSLPGLRGLTPNDIRGKITVLESKKKRGF